MFVPCPHCGFLVALIVSRDAPSQRCPRCGKELHTEELHGDDEATPAIVFGGVPAESVGDGGLAGGLTPPMTPSPVAADKAVDAEASFAAHESASPVGDNAAGAISSDAPGDIDTDTGSSGSGSGSGDDGSRDALAAASTGSVPRPRRRAERTSSGKRRLPSFARRHAPAVSGGLGWRGALLAAALLAVLAVQLLLAQRDELAASPRWRPLASGVCTTLGCELPAWREPRAFTMLSRSVQPAPGRPRVLTVEASFRNDARWPQPWPVLWLGLSDADARVAAQRAFTAREYLGPDADAAPGLAPGQSANVRFEIAEPATQTVAFTFEFH